MKKYRLFELVRKLDNWEMKRLEEMVCSPFFNKNKKVIKLFELLKEFAPEYNLSEEEKEMIAGTLFPGRKWHDASLSFLRSRLLELVNKLIIHLELEERSNYKSHLLIKGLLKRENNNYALSIYNQTNKHNKLQTKFDIDFYYEQYLLEENYIDYLEREKGRYSREHLIKLSQSLDTYYFARKLNISVELLSSKTIIGLDSQDIVLDNIEHIVSHPLYQENTFIKLYYYILQIFRDEENEDAYHSLIEFLTSTTSKVFYKGDLNIFYTHAANYCNRRIKSGRIDFKNHLFAIYLVLFENRLVYENNYIRVNRMKNMISLACQLGRTDWAKEFLDNNKKDLNPKVKAPATKMFNAFICFYNNDFKGTLFELSQIQIEIDALYFLNTRTFQIRCYYELSQSEAFYNLRNTFLDYLRRTKKISTTKKKSHSNFTRLAYMLFRKKEGLSRKPIADIRDKIETTKPLELKAWLQGKLEELE